MKRILVTSLLAVACVSAMAQGKVTFGNNADHLVVFTSDAASLTAAYKAMAGLPVPQANMGSFTAELYGGATSSALALQKSVVAGSAAMDAGRLANTTVTLTGVAAGTAAYFQVKLYETAAGSYAAASVSGDYLSGASSVFTTVPGSMLYNSIVSSAAPALSTWAAETIKLASVPEPSTMALAGLGAAALLIFRRRK